MSGHSKWATIKHKKGAADARRGKIFSRLAKEIMISAKQSGGDPNQNITLRTLIQKAKGVNMPNENIDRAVKKGTGEIESAALEEIVYEGYATGGVGLVVMCLTDNKNRAAAEIRHTFSRHGSSFAAQGSVTRGFVRKGQIIVAASAVPEDKLMELAIEAGADDMQPDGEDFEILTDPLAFNDVMAALTKAGITPLNAEVALVPTVWVPVADKAAARAVMKFVADLEEHDDVQNVYTNMDVDEALLKELSDEGE